MKADREPISDQAKWQVLTDAEEDYRRSKILAGLQQAQRGEGMDEPKAREWAEQLKARLAQKN